VATERIIAEASVVEIADVDEADDDHLKQVYDQPQSPRAARTIGRTTPQTQTGGTFLGHSATFG